MTITGYLFIPMVEMLLEFYHNLFQGFISKSVARQCAASIRSMSDNLEFCIQHVLIDLLLERSYNILYALRKKALVYLF